LILGAVKRWACDLLSLHWTANHEQLYEVHGHRQDAALGKKGEMLLPMGKGDIG